MNEHGQPETQKKRRGRVFPVVFGVCLALLLVWAAAEIARFCLTVIVPVSGSSMERTISDGDIVYAIPSAEPERGDIVLVDASESDYFRAADAEVTTVIKRLVAVGGDVIKCEDGVVWRKEGGGDFFPLDEPYAVGITPDFGPVELREGEIFFLGDNRASSLDSADLVRDGQPLLLRQDIVGVVPQWAVALKGVVTPVEGFRLTVGNWLRGLFS